MPLLSWVYSFWLLYYIIGDKEFILEAGTRGTRSDLVLLNPSNQQLYCSLFKPISNNTDPLPCIIYLHGNCSSRLEILPLLKYGLSEGYCMVGFDFSGCGLSEGEYVTLGYKESQDLETVIKNLR